MTPSYLPKMNVSVPDFDVDQLIVLIEARPVLWDKTNTKYKDKSKTQQAWREVLNELEPMYKEFNTIQKMSFGKNVQKKWTHIRDSYRKSLVKNKAFLTFGAAGAKPKTYIHANQMQFLDKVFCENDETSFLEELNDTNSGGMTEEKPVLTSPMPGASSYKLESTFDVQTPQNNYDKPPSKKRKFDWESEFMSANASKKPNRHMLFFNGILPSLENFDEMDILEFQMEVLKAVQKIQKKKQPGSSVSSSQVSNVQHSAPFQPNFHTSSADHFLSKPRSSNTSPSGSDVSSYNDFDVKSIVKAELTEDNEEWPGPGVDEDEQN